METYDAILIGSGHNALIAAAYLTRSGRSVLMLEKNDRPGGLVRTDELTLPDIPSAIIGHSVITPDTLAQFSPNQGPGDPYGGAHDLAQSYLFSPLPGQPGHATSVPNLFMLGAATWPGHGINGGSGYIVAHQILNTL